MSEGDNIDEYLFRKADGDLLTETYSDIEKERRYIKEHHVELTPVQKFFTRNMGLWVGKLSEKKAFDEIDARRQLIAVGHQTILGKLYPQRLNPLWKGADEKVSRSASALRTYTIWTIILVFFFFSLIGWGWEVSIHLVKDGIFVNRGVMHGPWLPVYGSGVAMILLVLARWRVKASRIMMPIRMSHMLIRTTATSLTFVPVGPVIRSPSTFPSAV